VSHARATAAGPTAASASTRRRARSTRAPARGPPLSRALVRDGRVPLLPDEEPTGLQRVLAVADSGNGVSAVLPLGEWLFINPELTVHFRREPRGE
jgi:hypothetical protein